MYFLQFSRFHPKELLDELVRPKLDGSAQYRPGYARGRARPKRGETILARYGLQRAQDISWGAGVRAFGRGGEGGEGCTQFVHNPAHPYYAATEHVHFSPTRQTLLAPSAKRREVFGESHEG